MSFSDLQFDENLKKNICFPKVLYIYNQILRTTFDKHQESN